MKPFKDLSADVRLYFQKDELAYTTRNLELAPEYVQKEAGVFVAEFGRLRTCRYCKEWSDDLIRLFLEEVRKQGTTIHYSENLVTRSLVWPKTQDMRLWRQVHERTAYGYGEIPQEWRRTT